MAGSSLEEERSAQLVLVNRNSTVLGQLPIVHTKIPFWSEVESIVQEVRRRHGIDVTIVRLLDVERGGFMRGGRVTYLAETDDPIIGTPWDGVLDEQPNRNHYAEVGGARADIAWAEDVLRRRGLTRTGPAVQVRTWNLSSLWRIPAGSDQVWLKAVPPFFAHEGRLIDAMAPDSRIPSLLAYESSRMLMAEIPGEDLYQATLSQRLKMIGLLVDIQRSWIDRVGELFNLRLPDGRDGALVAAIGSVFERRRDELPADVGGELERLIEGLGQRMHAIRDCGLPDTLVHGDFHPGNLRGHGDEFVLLDWGDAFVGHPLLDHSAFLERAPEEWRPTLQAHWLQQWQHAFPHSDPARAWTLLEPVAAARAAAVYQHFLDHIEPAERRYHESDPIDWLHHAAKLARQEQG
jgi:hypothetical protein